MKLLMIAAITYILTENKEWTKEQLKNLPTLVKNLNMCFQKLVERFSSKNKETTEVMDDN